MSFGDILRNLTAASSVNAHSAGDNSLLFRELYSLVKQECLNQAQGLNPPTNAPVRTFTLDVVASINTASQILAPATSTLAPPSLNALITGVFNITLADTTNYFTVGKITVPTTVGLQLVEYTGNNIPFNTLTGCALVGGGEYTTTFGDVLKITPFTVPYAPFATSDTIILRDMLITKFTSEGVVVAKSGTFNLTFSW